MMETIMTKGETTISGYLEEELTVKLTRREIYWLRQHCQKRIEQVQQALHDPRSSPARRSARWQEYLFHAELNDRLHGIYMTADERREAFMEEAVEQAEKIELMQKELEERVAQFRRAADAAKEVKTS